MRLYQVLLLATALPLSAQQNARPVAVVSGIVLCDDTQGPARDAGVELLRTDQKFAGHFVANPLTTHTDIYGRYLISSVPNGTYAVLISYAGYLSPLELRKPTMSHNGDWLDDFVAAAKASGEQLVTVAGDTAARTITLSRSASLSGHVHYADGAPASNVGLTVEDATTGDEVLPMHHSNRVTDDYGYFRLSGFPAGKYRVAAQLSHQAIQATSREGTSRDDVSDLRLYSGDTFHVNAAQVYTLRPPEAINDIEIAIPLGALHTLQGSILAPDGAPINGGDITLTDVADENITFTTFPGKQGEFSIGNVPAGTYTLQLSNPCILEHHVKLALGGGTDWNSTVRAFVAIEQQIIVTDTDPTPLTLKPAEVHLDPAKVKHDAETPPNFAR